jgi:signal transduction histidine kinase
MTEVTAVELARWVSTALRNPLAPIRSAVYLLRRRQLGDAELERWVEILDRQSARLANFADELLEMSQLGQGKPSAQPQEFALALVVAGALQGCQGHMEAYGQTLQIELPKGPVVLRGDPVRLVRVLRILIHESSRCARPGAAISLTVSLLVHEIQIVVCEAGVGTMRELQEFAPDVFDPFSSNVRPGEWRASEGRLGLILARQALQPLGGELEVRGDAAGTGGEFVIRVPTACIASTAFLPGSLEPSAQRAGELTAKTSLLLVRSD